MINCIIVSCVNYAVNMAAAITWSHVIIGNTIYGAENKLGVAFNLPAGSGSMLLMNNIVCGFVTGMAHATAGATGVMANYNDYYNNTTDVTNAQKGPNDLALDPTFGSVGQVTGTAGVFTAGNDRLVDTAKNFATLGVVAGRDYLYIKSGTGSTAGIYGIASIATTTNANDTLVLDIAPGTNTTADKVYQITIGRNFSIGTNLKAGGFPGAFQGGYSTGYMDVGAVQRVEPAGGGGMIVHPGMAGGT